MADLSTKEKWWDEVRARKDDLKKLFYEDVGVRPNVHVFEILERERKYGRGSKWNEMAFGTGLGTERTGEIDGVIDRMIAEEDPRLWYFFQGIWEDVPDSRKIHSYHFWHGFCDLCSEGMGMII